MKKILIIFLVLTMVLLVTACGGNGEKFEWSDIELSNMLPTPESDRAEIHTNSDNELWIDINKTTEKQYNDYIKACEERGFTVDSEESSISFEAYNKEGYKLDLTYYGSSEEMWIMLDSPMEMSEFQWPNSEVAKLLPVPKSNIGDIAWEDSNGFVISIGDTPISDYNEYVQACSAAGFNVDYRKGDKYYSADNEDGYHLSVDYRGYNIMFVRIDAPDTDEESAAESADDTTVGDDATVDDNEEATDASEETNDSQETSEDESSDAELVDGMRPEFKEAMDSYEAFFDEYVVFMKEYSDSENTLDMLADYTDWLTDYADTMEKLEVLDDGLEGEELKYYIEVMSRISEKLLEAAEYMGA